jgi:hypothetical protein
MNWDDSVPARIGDAGTAASAVLMIESGPKTSFIAMNAAAMPAFEARNWRDHALVELVRNARCRLDPSLVRCLRRGVNSPFRTIWVGTGVGNDTDSPV